MPSRSRHDYPNKEVYDDYVLDSYPDEPSTGQHDRYYDSRGNQTPRGYADDYYNSHPAATTDLPDDRGRSYARGSRRRSRSSSSKAPARSKSRARMALESLQAGNAAQAALNMIKPRSQSEAATKGSHSSRHKSPATRGHRRHQPDYDSDYYLSDSDSDYPSYRKPSRTQRRRRGRYDSDYYDSDDSDDGYRSSRSHRSHKPRSSHYDSDDGYKRSRSGTTHDSRSTRPRRARSQGPSGSSTRRRRNSENQKWGQAAGAAITAGAIQAWKMRSARGTRADKAQSIATAALSAGAINAGLAGKNPDEKVGRNTMSSALGGLAMGKIANKR